MEKKILNVGDTFMAPKNVPHAYVTLGVETARMVSVFDPAGKIEELFAEYARILSAPGPPDSKQIEMLNAECDMKAVGPPLKATLLRAKKLDGSQ